jgi:hypothetical protein
MINVKEDKEPCEAKVVVKEEGAHETIYGWGVGAAFSREGAGGTDRGREVGDLGNQCKRRGLSLDIVPK